MVSLSEVWELAAAILFMIGAAALLWYLFGRLMRPIRGEQIWMVLPGEGDGEGAGRDPALAGLVPGERRVPGLAVILTGA
mgnify:CR=1 FL=1